MRRPVVVALAAVAAALTLTGCRWPADPCETVPAPTPVELAAAAGGAQVEREIGAVECDLVDGRWTRET